jgi:hypothetical protein
MRAPRRRTAAGALLASLLLVAASPALAQDATAYGNEADYDAAAGAADFTIDFNGSTGALVAGSSFSAAVSFGSPEATDATQVNWSSDAISDAGSTTSVNGVGPMDGTFTGTAMAFKFTFSSNANAPTVDLYAEDATLIASLTAPNAPGFFGVVSTKAVKRFVITPAAFTDGTGNLDRFFIDDFSATAEVAAPPPPTADLSAMCHDLAAAFAATDASAFRGRNRQRAFANKLRAVCARIDDGDLCAALSKLRHDILPKTDGEGRPKDWVTDATAQQALEDQVNALVAALEDAIEAAGGCPSDPSDDDGEGDGPSANGLAHGRGHR